jgi:hypothetical protein
MLNNPPHDKNRIAVVSVLCNTEFPFYFSLWVNLIRKFTPFNTDIVILTAGQLTENIFLEKGLTVHTISNDSILSVRSCKVSAIHAFQMAEFDKIIFPCSTCVMSKITSDFFMSTLNSISLFSYINLLRNKKIILKDSHNEIITKIVERFKPVFYNISDSSQQLINQLSIQKENPKIIFSITTCKRLDLFKKTIYSILNNWVDISKVDYFLCVDDNSSEEDRSEMKTLFPFFKSYQDNKINSYKLIENIKRKHRPHFGRIFTRGKII